LGDVWACDGYAVVGIPVVSVLARFSVINWATLFFLINEKAFQKCIHCNATSPRSMGPAVVEACRWFRRIMQETDFVVTRHHHHLQMNAQISHGNNFD
jgi:Fe-S-cluster-containing dehydrogenase component